MKRLLPPMSTVVFLLVSSFAAAQTPPAAAPQTLTLQEAVRIALEKNPTVQAAEAYSDAVEQGIREAKAARLPRLDLSEGFTRGNNPVYVFGSLLTQRQFTAADFALNKLNAPTPIDNFRTQFTATMPLYDAGQISRHVKDARLNAQSAVKSQQRTSQEVIFGVVKAYLNELLARESVQVAESAVEAAKSDVARAQARQEQGLAVPSDLLSAKVQLAQAQQDLLQAQNAVALGHAGLNVAMGLPEDTPGKVESGLREVSFEAGSLDEWQKRALGTRPDYLAAELGRQRALNGTRMARAEFLPKIGLFSSWEQDNQTFLTRGGNNWTAGAMLTFNIFNGGSDRARLAAAQARQRQAEAQLAQMASGVRLQVREAYLNLETARQRIDVSRQAQSEAAESLRILQNRYDSGLATITDLLRMETARTAAQSNYLNALYDYRISYAALELASGELAPNSQAVTQ